VTGPDAFARLDPRARALGALALIAAALVLDGLAAPAFAVAAALGLALAAGWRPGPLARRLAHVEGITLALVAALPFATPGAPLLTLGPLAASAEGLSLAAAMALRVNACVLLTLALIAPLGPEGLGRALSGLGAPPRLTALLLLTARYAGLLRAELSRQTEAMRARAFRPGLSLHALRAWGWLVGMTLTRALDRAERASEAMRLRGWRGVLPVAPPAPLGPADAAFAAATLAALAAALMVRAP
jgi:cobalt/nickel transport system permease protein